jgi:SmpA / OmlA family
MKKTMVLALLCASLLALTSDCNRNALTGSKLTLSNYNQITNGMTKAQVERIMGPPTTNDQVTRAHKLFILVMPLRKSRHFSQKAVSSFPAMLIS